MEGEGVRPGEGWSDRPSGATLRAWEQDREIRQARPHRPGHLPHLPGLHELRGARARQPHPGRCTRTKRPSSGRRSSTGINFFDTANVYSGGTSEEILGRALPDFATHDEIVLATKVNGRMRQGTEWRRSSRKAIMTEVDNSLRRLRHGLHRPLPDPPFDHGTTVEETMEALHDVVKAGKVRYIGASSMYAWQFAKALYTADVHGWTRFVVHAGPLQPALPGGGAGDAPALRTTRASA